MNSPALSQLRRVWVQVSTKIRAHERLSTGEQILFSKRLSIYLHSGIPIAQALELICEDARSTAHASMLRRMTDAVYEGVPLSGALSLFPRSYANFALQLIVVGEATGTLSQSLAHVASVLTRQRKLIRAVRSALIYPALIAIGTIAVSGFLALYAFPKIVPLFRGLHTSLPLSTRLLIGAVGLIQKHGWFILVAAGGGLVVTLYVLRIPRHRHYVEYALLRIPIMGELIRSYHLASIHRMLGVLLGSGTRIEASLERVAHGLGSHAYRESITGISESIIAGTRLSEALKAHPKLFPTLVVQLVGVGEMTGTLSEGMETIAGIYEERVEQQSQALSSLLEPLLMIAMGLVVGFVALAIITPMYGLTQSLGPH